MSGYVTFSKSGFLIEHGTENAYGNHGCRCPDCREAHRKVTQERRKARTGSDKTPHGTVNGYTNWNCRCELCKAAMKKGKK